MTDQTLKTTTVDLEEPIVRGETKITKVILQKPKGGALRGTSMNDVLNSDVNTMFKVIPRISTPSITEAELIDMEADDLTSLCGAVVDFFLGKTKRASLGL